MTKGQEDRKGLLGIPLETMSKADTFLEITALRARVEELEGALEWSLDEIDVLSNKLVKWAYPQGMAMIGREQQFDNYKSACLARSSSTRGRKP